MTDGKHLLLDILTDGSKKIISRPGGMTKFDQTLNFLVFSTYFAHFRTSSDHFWGF